VFALGEWKGCVKQRAGLPENGSQITNIWSIVKMVDLVKPFKVVGNISGIFEITDSSSNIRTTDTRTATDLGWRHSIELRLEML
jgi:hypothetical protein